MLVVRGTRKLRERVTATPAGEGDASTTVLGDWFATALFWRPQVALLVNRRTLLPLFVELAPAATLVDRVPAAIASILRRHAVDDKFIAAELAAMKEVRIAPTNDRSVVGVMNEFAFHGEYHRKDGLQDPASLSLYMAHLPVGPLRHRTGFPDRELAALVRSSNQPGTVIPFPRAPAQLEPAPTARATSDSLFQLKITLLETKPPVWRRVIVDGQRTLDHLHEAIQAAFGWWNCHLHEFEIGRTRYGVPDPDEDWDPPLDERRIRIDAIAGEGTSFRYTYDFGDGWDHRVVVEKIGSAAPAIAVPGCLDGRRACPPEDCGGARGYRELLSVLADPTHSEHSRRLEWVGGGFDPEAFDVNDFEDNLRNGRLSTFHDDT